MTADNGKMQEETTKSALGVVTAMLDGDRRLTMDTVAEIARDLLDSDEDNHTKLFVYVHQAAQLTELALGIASMASGKPVNEIHEALAGAIATADWSDEAIGES